MDGGGASFGQRIHIRPSCFIRPGFTPGIVAEAPEEVGAHGAADRTPGILRQREARERPRRQRIRRRQVDRRAERYRARIDGDGALAQQRHAERPVRTIDLRFERAGLGRGDFAEEHVARILVEERTELFRIAPAPLANPLHRCALERHLAALDENPPDRAIRMTVLIGIADAHHSALGEAHAAGALDLQEERFDGIRDVDEHLVGDRCAPVLDVGARPIGDDALALDAPAQPLVLELRVELGQIDRQQVVRRRVQRHAVARGACAAAIEQRFVVAGDHAGVAPVRGHDLVWDKMIFEECARAAAVDRRNLLRSDARALPQRARRGGRDERRASGAKRGPRFVDAIVGPAGKRGPRDRGVLRRQRRRCGRRYGAGAASPPAAPALAW